MSDTDPMTGENSPEGKPGTKDTSDAGYGVGGDFEGNPEHEVAPRGHLGRDDS
jgi:hypothetical protein